MGHILQTDQKPPQSRTLFLSYVVIYLYFCDCYYLSELKLEAVTMTSSLFWTNTGIFLQPGDFSNLCNSLRVSADTRVRLCQHSFSTCTDWSSTLNQGQLQRGLCPHRVITHLPPQRFHTL